MSETPKTPNPPAFPLVGAEQHICNQDPLPQQSGMLLLDYFAAKAIEGQAWASGMDEALAKECAKRAYILASAMLKERTKHIQQ